MYFMKLAVFEFIFYKLKDSRESNTFILFHCITPGLFIHSLKLKLCHNQTESTSLLLWAKMKFQAFLLFSLVLSFLLVISAENEQCGKQAGGALCPNDDCCSKDGFCGITATYCGEGCQSQCHHLSSFLDQSTFDEVFPNQNSSNCPSQGFYTYDALINAAKSFSGFASVGDDGTRKREIAAFLAQISHESSG